MAINGWLTQNAGTSAPALSLDGKMIRSIIGTVTLAEHHNGSPMAVMDQKEGTQRCEQTAATRHPPSWNFAPFASSRDPS